METNLNDWVESYDVHIDADGPWKMLQTKDLTAAPTTTSRADVDLALAVLETWVHRRKDKVPNSRSSDCQGAVTDRHMDGREQARWQTPGVCTEQWGQGVLEATWWACGVCLTAREAGPRWCSHREAAWGGVRGEELFESSTFKSLFVFGATLVGNIGGILNFWICERLKVDSGSACQLPLDR